MPTPLCFCCCVGALIWFLIALCQVLLVKTSQCASTVSVNIKKQTCSNAWPENHSRYCQSNLLLLIYNRLKLSVWKNVHLDVIFLTRKSKYFGRFNWKPQSGSFPRIKPVISMLITSEKLLTRTAEFGSGSGLIWSWMTENTENRVSTIRAGCTVARQKQSIGGTESSLRLCSAQFQKDNIWAQLQNQILRFSSTKPEWRQPDRTFIKCHQQFRMKEPDWLTGRRAAEGNHETPPGRNPDISLRFLPWSDFWM